MALAGSTMSGPAAPIVANDMSLTESWETSKMGA